MTIVWVSDDPNRIERNTRSLHAAVLRRLGNQSLSSLEGGSPHLRSKGCRARFSRAVHPPRRRRLDRTICIPSSAVARRGTRRRATRSWGHGDDGERLGPANRNRIVPASRATATGRAIMKRGGARPRQHVFGGSGERWLGGAAFFPPGPPGPPPPPSPLRPPPPPGRPA